MRIAVVFNILGLLLISLAGTMLLPIPFSIYYEDGAATALIFSALISATAGFLSFFFTRKEKDLRTREGFAIVTFSWIFFSLFGSLPFLFSGAIPSFTDAFFETMSGFSTTGASILTNIETLPESILFWRSLTHWLGGMGIIVLSIAILPFLGVGGMQLFKAEVPGPVADRLTPRITETAKILWGVYVFFTALEAALLMLGGMNLFESLCHTFGTMATGGFSTRNTSVGAYQSAYVDYVVIIFMIIAGTNFSTHYRFLKGEWTAYFKNKEFLFFLSIIGIGTLFIGMDIYFRQSESIFRTLQVALFQVVSILTTTGYATADYEQWAFNSQFILFVMMFIGGCAGSTGGGMKVIRIYVLIKFIFSEFTRLLHPRAVVPVRIGQNVISRDILMDILSFLILFILLFVVGVFIMTAFGMDMETAFGAGAATLGNIGPGLGDVGPTDNYSHFPAAVKWILSLFMLMGRLEIFTVVILLSPAFWER